MAELEKIIDKRQPIVIYHTSLGARPMRRSFKFDGRKIRLVSNIHVTLVIGYDDQHYYYIDPLWSHIKKGVIVPAIFPNQKQIIKIKKSKMERSFNAPGRMCLYVDPK